MVGRGEQAADDHAGRGGEVTTPRNVGLATLGNLVVPVASLVTQPLLALGLGVDGRGELAAATVPLSLVVASFTLGIPEALTHYVAKRMVGSSVLLQCLGLLAVAGMIGTLAIALLSGPLSVNSTYLQGLMIVAAAFAAPALVNAGLRGIAAGHHRWGLVALSRALGALFQLFAVLTLYVAGQLTPLTATLSIAVGSCIGGVVFLPRPTTRTEPIPAPDAPTKLPEMIGYGWRMWAGALAGVLVMRLDQLLITPLSTVTQLGLYAVAASVAEVILVANAGIRDVVFAAESREQNRSRAAYATRISSLVVAILAAGVALLSPWAVPLFFGSEFGAALPSIYILLAATVLGNPGSIPGMVMAGWGRPGLRSISLALALGVNGLAIVLLVPSLGAIGAALATLLSSCVAGWTNIYWLWRHFDVSPTDVLVPRIEDLTRMANTVRGA